MKNILTLALIVLSLAGCTIISGPISGKGYLVGGQSNFPHVEQKDPDKCFMNYGSVHFIVPSANEAKYIQECRQYAINKHPEWEEKYKEAVLSGKIMLGMTDLQAYASWGMPENRNESVGSWGIKEQWVYGDTYVYFENGKLASWQD